MILVENDPVLVVGGGEADPQDIRDFAILASVVVAADGGAKALGAAGLRPHHVIGDLDSLAPQDREAFADVLYHVSEQSTTDFEKCVSRITSPLIYALGFTGGRVDHFLSVVNVMARYADKRIILVGPEDVSVVVRGTLALSLDTGTRLSIMPLEALNCETQGLRWNLSGQRLDPLGLTSISNETLDSSQRITLSGLALLSVPRASRSVLEEAL